MTRTLKGSLLTAALLLLVTPASAQEKQAPPPMTPEQQAEMEAYMKAGQPGAPHQALAAQAGSYETKTKSWHEPGGPMMTKDCDLPAAIKAAY